MRSALEINNREMWRQMEDRKRLNATFSHDLRTPLTVLEGHLGILQKYTPAGIMLVSGVIYIGKTMELVWGVCGLVVILQLIIFIVLRSRAIKDNI